MYTISEKMCGKFGATLKKDYSFDPKNVDKNSFVGRMHR